MQALYVVTDGFPVERATNQQKKWLTTFVESVQALLRQTAHRDEKFPAHILRPQDVVSRAAMMKWLDVAFFPHSMRPRKDLGGFLPEHWGPVLWKFMHELPQLYVDTPETQDIRLWTQVYMALGHVLPCESCSKHFMQFFSPASPQYAPSDYKNQFEMQKWVSDVHTAVTLRIKGTGKAIQITGKSSTSKKECDCMKGKPPPTIKPPKSHLRAGRKRGLLNEIRLAGLTQ